MERNILCLFFENQILNLCSYFWLREFVHLPQRIVLSRLFLIIRLKEIETSMFAQLCARCYTEQTKVPKNFIAFECACARACVHVCVFQCKGENKF